MDQDGNKSWNNYRTFISDISYTKSQVDYTVVNRKWKNSFTALRLIMYSEEWGQTTVL